MTYRSDHEAAIARIEVLERELARQRDAQTAEVAVEEPRRKPWWLVGMGLAALVAGVFGGVVIGVVDDDAPQQVKRNDSPVHRGRLATCAAGIQRAWGLDERSTDPRLERPVSVASLARTGAPCRDELHELVELGVDDDERNALWQWAVAEDELAGAISRIEVYYANDPYKLDSYSTARQLWREYDRAYSNRNRALQTWRVMFMGS